MQSVIHSNNFLDKFPTSLQTISKKVFNNERISIEDALILYKEAELGMLGILANYIREKKNGNYAYFNKNLHIEPTNLCVFDCKFCSYSRLLKQKEDSDAWTLTDIQILDMVKNCTEDITEVHIVGGVHPKMNLHYFAD